MALTTFTMKVERLKSNFISRDKENKSNLKNVEKGKND